MEFQTFRGADVQEALSSVREALGADALIESTRHVRSDGSNSALGQSFVEIVAGPSASSASARGIERRAAAGLEGRAARPELARRARQRATAATPGRAAEPAPSLEDTVIGRELAQLRLMLDELSQGRPPRDRTRALLAAAGFEGALARTLATGGTRAQRVSSRELRHCLRQRVGERLSCRAGLIEAPGRRLIACVGPTGVGKTTTLAKLAARAVLTFGRSIRVVSLDTFRVGAVEQWRRYAELIGFPFDVVDNPGTFHRIAHNHGEELLLVDTAGRSVGEQHSALSGCVAGLREMSPDVLLVLPAWLRARDAERALATYASPPITGVVITKLDETDQVGGVMHAPMGSELPITYLCNGARVPEDIQDAAVEKVLDAIFPEQA